jgi:hypothetical protein
MRPLTKTTTAAPTMSVNSCSDQSGAGTASVFAARGLALRIIGAAIRVKLYERDLLDGSPMGDHDLALRAGSDDRAPAVQPLSGEGCRNRLR